MKIIAIEKRLKVLSKIKIGRRLFIGFSLLLLFILIVGVGSILNVSLLSDQISVLNEMMDTENSVASARFEQLCFEAEGTMESADKTQVYIDDAKQAIDLLEMDLKNTEYEEKPAEIRELLADYELNFQAYVDLEDKKEEQNIKRENASTIVITSIQETMDIHKKYSTTQMETGILRATFDKYRILGEALDSYREILVLEKKYIDDETDELSKEIIGEIVGTDSALMSARAIMKDEDVRTSLVEARNALEEYKITFEEYAVLVETQITAKEEMDINAELVAAEIAVLKEEIVASAEKVEETSNQTTVIMLVVAFVFGVAASYVITISITHPLRRINKRIQKFADYNVSEDLPSDLLSYKDEMGVTAVSLQQIVDNMKEIIGDITNASENLTTSSKDLARTASASADSIYEISGVIEGISKSVTEQAGHSEDGAFRSNEMGTLIVEDQKQIFQLTQTADKVTHLKDEGLVLLETLVVKTDENNEASKYVYQIVKETNESARKIEDASQMIQNIAAQTNLLALNAAIEAARAGEAGRGFSVVADEIRKLAEQSNQFSGEISAVIVELMSKASQAVGTMKNMQETVEEQSIGVRNTNEKFEGIAEAIDLMKNSIGQINNSAEMMSDKKEQMIRVMEVLSAISEENAASTEDAASRMEEQTASIDELSQSSNSLSDLSSQMNQIVKKFEL